MWRSLRLKNPSRLKFSSDRRRSDRQPFDTTKFSFERDAEGAARQPFLSAGGEELGSSKSCLRCLATINRARLVGDHPGDNSLPPEFGPVVRLANIRRNKRHTEAIRVAGGSFRQQYFQQGKARRGDVSCSFERHQTRACQIRSAQVGLQILSSPTRSAREAGHCAAPIEFYQFVHECFWYQHSCKKSKLPQQT
jgi:hypothetical protein